jgi:predicted nuclease of restriction endonuclease-like (RecB) superfamily
MNIKNLAELLKSTSQFFQARAISAVNSSLTLRNWLFGYYIVEYEQKGEDRAVYGDKLLRKLEIDLKNEIHDISLTYLKNVRKFYLTYPQIGQTVSDLFIKASLPDNRWLQIPVKSQTTSDQFYKIPEQKFRNEIEDKLKKLEIYTPGVNLIEKISFSHFVELLSINGQLKRTFYEIETIKGTWSVRELKRQIATLYFERSGLSKNNEKLHTLVNLKTEKFSPSDILKNPYTFEFLGLPNKEILHESELEQALIDNLQQFLVELGNGFCFEARQKRILIGDEYFFIDLVFYHRILKCHILIDLKVNEFSHSDAGQLNAYLNYFKKEIKQKSDRNPVGILLCTGSNNTLVKYATAGMSKNLFVSQYLINLPTEQELKEFVDRKMLELK